MKKLNIAVSFLLATAITGCTAARYKLADKDQERLPPYPGPVCLLTTPIPPDVDYTEIGMVRASKRFYGLASELYPLLADQSRIIGGDAVINVQSKQQIGIVSVVRPVTWGTAIKLSNPKDFKCKDFDGAWF